MVLGPRLSVVATLVPENFILTDRDSSACAPDPMPRTNTVVNNRARLVAALVRFMAVSLVFRGVLFGFALLPLQGVKSGRTGSVDRGFHGKTVTTRGAGCRR